MDETNTANSSSAAAVADGASAAAHTKTVAAAPVKSASHIKLLIKSSNQQYEDHVIESDLLWTVKMLKTHLSLVYPSKPPAADQKLIYSGQLLADNVQLKDVIRSYKDVYTQNHIIHLVYTPKNLPPPATSSTSKTKTSSSSVTANGSVSPGSSGGVSSVNNMTNTDGLRQRHAVGNNSAGQQQPTTASMQQSSLFYQNMYPYFMTPQMMSATATNANGVSNCQQIPSPLGTVFGTPFNVQAIISQQAAMYNWMQQVYTQYMEQCLRLANTAGDGTSTDSSSTVTPPFPSIPPNFQQFLQQQFPSTVMSPPLVSGTVNTAASNERTAVAGQNQQQQQQQQEQPALAQVAAPRIPNLPQDEQDNRDWLDNFFSITRLALFLTLLYFNSSPVRCLVVVIIAGGIYLYHIGVFRLRQERNNNNLNRNNNAAQNAAVDQIRQGVDQQQNGAAPPAEGQEANIINNNNDNNAEGEQTPQQQEQTETTTSVDAVDNTNNESMMSTIRTFVVTFFTSLLPETPAL